jgi:hypothetical protein
MAKSPSSKKKGAKAQRTKVGTFTDAMRALQLLPDATITSGLRAESSPVIRAKSLPA